MSIQNLLPVDDGLGSIGSATKKWATCHFNQGLFSNVGIGTTNPNAKLEVVETSSGVQLEVRGTSSVGGQFQVANAGDDIYVNLRAAGSSDDAIKLDTNGPSFFNGGNVGIGTTSPNYALDVNGTIASTGLNILKTEANTYSGSIQSLNSGFTLRNTLDTDGALQSIGINFALETTENGFTRSSWIGSVQDQANLRFSSLIFGTDEGASTQPNRTEKMRISYNGNVGIGTNSPSAKLEVAGDTKINGQLTVTGKTITEEVETVTTSNGVIFEGSAADDNELTLKAGSLTADRVITLPDSTGTVALTSDLTNTSNVTQASVTQHQSALRITESQITDLKNYLTSYTVTSADVTAHQGSLTITESQISDLGNYLTSVSWSQISNKPATFAPSTHTLKSHSDVSTTNPSDGQVLKWNASQSKWAPAADNSGIGSVSWGDISGKPATFAPSSHSLNDHSDVTLSTPSNGDALVYNGSKWVNSKPTEPAFFTSDAMLKSEVSEIISSVEKIKSIRGVNFVWNKDAPDDLAGKRDVGVIAQEIQKVVPEAVKKSPEGVLTVAYHKLIPLLIETIKDQEKRIAKLEERS